MAKYLISHPDPTFTAALVGVNFVDGTATVDTDASGGLAAYSYFQRAGYGVTPVETAEADAPSDASGQAEDGEFHPSDHNTAGVLGYLAEADDAERERVLALEAADKARKTILGGATANDEQGEQS